jgi:hypothetical protein
MSVSVSVSVSVCLSVCLCVFVCTCAPSQDEGERSVFWDFFLCRSNMEGWKNNLSTSYIGESGLRPVTMGPVIMENVFYSMENVFYTDLNPP